MSTRKSGPRVALSRARPPAALALLVVATVTGAVSGSIAGSDASRPPAAVADGPDARSHPGVPDHDRGVVRVAAHCSMTAGNRLVPEPDTAAPAGGAAGTRRTQARGGVIPPDFEPVAVIACGMAGSADRDGSLQQTALERRATVDLEPLLVAYQSPMPVFGDGGGCTAELDPDPAIAFVDASGDAIWPDAPRDACDHVTAAVQDLLAHLQWTTVDSRRV